MRVVILTGQELRHSFLRKALAGCDGINVAASYCEGLEKSLLVSHATEKDGDAVLRYRHAQARERSEKDFFGAFVALTPDRSNPVLLPKGAINSDGCVEEILALRADLLVAYGCSLIKGRLLDAYQGRFLNVHLGLSPYYRGAGTNFWPLVNGEPEFVGATFMHIDPGIDTGEIIHQVRARVFPGDTPHSIGNRLIADMTQLYAQIIRNFASLPRMPQIPVPDDARLYLQKHFSEDATAELCRQFDGGLVERYLAEEAERCARAPIVLNPLVQVDLG